VKSSVKVKVSLVLGKGEQPSWLADLAEKLGGSDKIDLRISCLASEYKLREVKRSHLFEFWKRLDAAAFSRKIGASEYSERLIQLEAGSEYRSSEEADIVVWMALRRPPAEAFAMAKFGVWTIADAFNIAYGFRELANREPVTRCDIIRLGDSTKNDKIIASAYAATDDLSLARSVYGVRAKCNTLLLSAIERVAIAKQPAKDLLVSDIPVLVKRGLPGLAQLLSGLGRLYGAYCIGLFKRPFYFDQWQLAFRLGGDRLDQNGLRRLTPTHNGFWADPFVVEREGRRFIFFEEYLQETRRGHIAAMELDKHGGVGEPFDVLKTKFHLSYPFLFEYGGELFMVPECAESGRVEALRCTQYPDRWEPHAVLIDNVTAFDPTLVEHDGMWWMFIALQPDGNSTDDELHLFYARTPFGPWTPHPLNPISLDVRCARPAGALFSSQGRLYRPAQDCSRRYGWAISLQEVVEMTTEDYKEVQVNHITPEWAGDAHATHTMNQSCGVTLYDCEVYRRKS